MNIQSLPNELQNLIFYYTSHPTADLIKNINWKKEFEIQMEKAKKRNIKFLEKYNDYILWGWNVYGFKMWSYIPKGAVYYEFKYRHFRHPKNGFKLIKEIGMDIRLDPYHKTFCLNDELDWRKNETKFELYFL